MTDPLVSVVIPLHNSEEWIAETVRSVQMQAADAPRMELVIVDSGSADRGPEIVRDMLAAGTLRYQWISLDGNCGPSFARNAGWRRSRAPWIQFLDSDDLLVQGKIAHQWTMASAAASEIAAVFSEWQSYCLDEEWKPVPPVFSPDLDDDAIQGLLSPCTFLATGSQLYRTAWLEKVGGYDESCWLIEDVHLNLRLVMAGGQFMAAPAGRALFYYRRRGSSSLSGSRRRDFLLGCVRNLRMAEDHWGDGQILTPGRLRFLLDSYEPLLHSLASVDPAKFSELLSHVQTLQPGWVPRHRRMRIMSRLVGYGNAERISIAYRTLKARL